MSAGSQRRSSFTRQTIAVGEVEPLPCGCGCLTVGQPGLAYVAAVSQLRSNDPDNTTVLVGGQASARGAGHNGLGERAAESASRSTLPRSFRPERPSFGGMAQVKRTPGGWQRQRFGPIGLHSLP